MTAGRVVPSCCRAAVEVEEEEARKACRKEEGGVVGILGGAGGNKRRGVVYVKGSSEGEEEVRTAVKGIDVLILSPRLSKGNQKTERRKSA